MVPEETIHASVARVGGRGVLIRGGSGAGKSSLLLALLMHADDAVLVADDRAVLRVEGGRLFAAAPAAIAGQMEVRGVGIIRRPHAALTAVDLVVDLLPLAECPRLPSPQERRVVLAGIALPRIFVASGAHDGHARVRVALAHDGTDI